MNEDKNLELQNVDFRYENSSEKIFENINLKFEKGKHTILTERTVQEKVLYWV